MTDFANPYRPGEPVAEPAMLFGRQSAADWIELQLIDDIRTLILNGSPLIGKTSFIRHVGALQNLAAIDLLVELSPPPPTPKSNKHPHQEGRYQGVINEVLQGVITQLIPQLESFGLISSSLLSNMTLRVNDSASYPLGNSEGIPVQPASALRQLFTQINERLGSKRLVLYFDDLHLLLTDDKALISAFLTSLMPLLDDCPRLHLVFVLNQDKRKQINHPLLDGAPAFSLSPLTADASLNMITNPVKNVLRFDYGVTKRIAEVNSHHPYYLCLFCHTLLNRQAFDGWVNQRDFDAALAELLELPIEPFRQIWDQSTWAERAVLAGLAAIQGAHGPMTRQEVIRFLQKQDNAIVPEVVIDALESMVERGVLAPMGAVSYRFHVELLRFWLRRHTNLSEILQEVDWPRAALQLKMAAKSDKATLPAVGSVTRPAKNKEHRRNRFLWPVALTLLITICLLTTGAVFAVRYLDLSLNFLKTPTVSPQISEEEESDKVVTRPTVTPTPEPTATATPTPALVVARTLPSLVFMAQDLNQSWRIYMMNTDGSGVTVLTPEGEDDTAPVWSPDGRKIAYVSQRDGNREIYVMDSNCLNLPGGCGANAINVTRHPADDWTPAWSSDGSRLLFSSIRAGNWEIFVLDMSCLADPETCPDKITQLTDDGNGNILPVWSPDGSRIAFSSKATGNWDIFTMNPSGVDLRQITTDPGNDLSPAWSPDSAQIAFETNRDGNVEIYVTGANGGADRNISNFSTANDHGPFWSPDGQFIVFYSNREGNWDILSATLDGQNVVNLTNTPTRDEQTPAWRP